MPHDTNSPRSPAASSPPASAALPDPCPAISALPRSPYRLHAHPAIQRAPSAPPHPPITSGSTSHALRGSLPAAPAPPDCGMAAAPATVPPAPTVAPLPPPASLPASCDPPPDGAAATATASVPSLDPA